MRHFGGQRLPADVRRQIDALLETVLQEGGARVGVGHTASVDSFDLLHTGDLVHPVCVCAWYGVKGRTRVTAEAEE